MRSVLCDAGYQEVSRALIFDGEGACDEPSGDVNVSKIPTIGRGGIGIHVGDVAAVLPNDGYFRVIICADA